MCSVRAGSDSYRLISSSYMFGGARTFRTKPIHTRYRQKLNFFTHEQGATPQPRGLIMIESNTYNRTCTTEFAKSWHLVQPLSPLSQAHNPHQACQHDRSTMHSVVTNIWLQSVLTACHIKKKLETFINQPTMATCRKHAGKILFIRSNI